MLTLEGSILKAVPSWLRSPTQEPKDRADGGVSESRERVPGLREGWVSGSRRSTVVWVGGWSPATSEPVLLGREMSSENDGNPVPSSNSAPQAPPQS